MTRTRPNAAEDFPSPTRLTLFAQYTQKQLVIVSAEVHVINTNMSTDPSTEDLGWEGLHETSCFERDRVQMLQREYMKKRTEGGERGWGRVTIHGRWAGWGELDREKKKINTCNITLKSKDRSQMKESKKAEHGTYTIT